jgi:hypothetical protein
VWDLLGMVHIDPAVDRTNALIAGAVQRTGKFFISLRAEMNHIKQELDQATSDLQAEDEKPNPDKIKHQQLTKLVTKLKQDTEQKKELFFRALQAANQHGDDAVIDNLGDHNRMNICLVNTLIGCLRAGDFSGKLPKAILEFLSNFSMNRIVAEKTNFDTIKKRLHDKGDDEVKRLLEDISSRIKKASKTQPETTDSPEGKKSAVPPASADKPAKPLSKPSSDGSPAKRLRDDDLDARTVKKVALETSSTSLSSKLGASKLSSSLQSKILPPKPRTATSILPGKNRPIPKPIPKAEPLKVEAPKVEPSKAAGTADSGKTVDSKAEVKKAPPVKPNANKLSALSKVEPIKPSVTKAPVSTSVLSGGIASLLDSINSTKKQKEPSKESTKEPADPQETPEQKEKRLRKEARRKLRVTFKEGDDLVQIKIFHKEAAEDEGRDDNMTRDAADDRSEGMMLKQRMSITEEEEEEDEIPYRPWVEPTLTDFSSIPWDVRDKTYVTRGGNLTFSTDEQKVMQERERRELMVIYTDPSDIPPTPKSPPPEISIMGTDIIVAHLPRDDPRFEEVHRRWKETQQHGPDGALYYALRRLSAKEDPASKVNSILNTLKSASSAPQPSHHTFVAPAPAPAPNPQPQPAIYQPSNNPPNPPPLPKGTVEEQIIALLMSDKVKTFTSESYNPAQPNTKRRYDYSDPHVQAAIDAIEEIASQLNGLPYPPIQPPNWMAADAERVREWWLGYQREAAAQAKKEAEERAVLEAQINALAAAQTQGTQDPWSAYYAQQQLYAQYAALLQSQGSAQQASSTPAVAASGGQLQAGDSQLQAILAAFNQPNHNQVNMAAAAPAAAPASTQASYPGLNPNDTTYQQIMMLSQLAQQQQGNTSQTSTSAASAVHSDRAGQINYGSDKEEKGKKGKNALPPHRPVNKALIGTKPCVFWQQGKCARGEKCTFRHDER